MLLDLFPFQLWMFFICSVCLVLWLVCNRGTSFSAPICSHLYSVLHATELGGRLGVLDLQMQVSWNQQQPSCFSGRSSPWFSKGSSVELASGAKQWIKGGRLESSDVLDTQDIGVWGKGRLPWVFCCRAGHKTRGWIWLGQHRERWRSAVYIPGSLTECVTSLQSDWRQLTSIPHEIHFGFSPP